METGAFFDAIKQGKVDEVRLRLTEDASVLSEKAESGESAALLAKYYGQAEILEVILETGYQPDVHEAAALGDRDRVQLLSGAQQVLVNTYSSDGFTPLQLAAYFGHPEIVHDLLDLGADLIPASRNPMGVTALHAAMATGNPESRRRIVKELIARGVDVNAKQEGGFTPLQAAEQNGDTDLAQLLREAGAVA